ncbi:flagellar protein FlaG [Magnetococcales bacterium HHB-1]
MNNAIADLGATAALLGKPEMGSILGSQQQRVVPGRLDVPAQEKKENERVGYGSAILRQEEVLPDGRVEKSKEFTPIEPLASDKTIIKGLVDEANRSLEGFTTLSFSIDKESNDFVVSVVDKRTEEVVRQIPSKNMQGLAKRMRELQGLLFDVKA